MELREQRARSSDVITCGECDSEIDKDVAIRDTYCSRDCFYRGKGQKALKAIKSDHTLCATCFRFIKCVEKPPWGTELKIEGPQGRADESVKKDCLVGYQYPTEHMEKTTRDAVDTDDPRAIVPVGLR